MKKRIVITGSQGLIGYHAHARLHAANCTAGFKGDPLPYDIVTLSHAEFDDDAVLNAAVTGADVVLHFAGINRDTDEAVEFGNQAIATRLVDACAAAGVKPHIVYANSTHASSDIPYGRGKKGAAKILSKHTDRFTDMILPHIFGEGARSFYNNVTATLIHELIAGNTPDVNPDGKVHLLHAGVAAQAAIDAVIQNQTGEIKPEPRSITVPDLAERLDGFHKTYEAGIYPNFKDDFDVALFNAYRTQTYPNGWPRPLKFHSDPRGTLFEAVKGGGGGQTFFSTTEPGITRGNHFHLMKVERFLVVQGEAMIRIRKVFSDDVWEYRVNGDAPSLVDMPTLHTHSIENIGDTPLLTLFWTHDIFDPQNPDTYADKVLSS